MRQKLKGLIRNSSARPLAATAALFTLDVIYLHGFSRQPLSLDAGLIWAVQVALSLALASLLLPVIPACSQTTAALGRWFATIAPLRTRPVLATALAVALTLAAPMAGFSWALFRGEGVARIPLLPILGPLAALCGLTLLVLIGWTLLEKGFRRAPWTRRTLRAVAILIALGLFLADARLFVGLYEDIHATLMVLALWIFAVAFRKSASEGEHSPQRLQARIALLGFGLAGCLLFTTSAALILRASPQARADVIERTLYSSRIVCSLQQLLPLAAEPLLDAPELHWEAIESQDLAALAVTDDPPDRHPDILLFSIDAVNTDRFPGRGYQRPVMPNVAKLLPRSVRFDRAYTTIPETQFALPGLIMSTTRDLGPAAAVRESGDTIATALRQVGYGTYWLYEAQDLFRGGGVLNNLEFDGFDGRFGVDDNALFATSDRLIELLETRSERPIFAWTHLFAPHAPYTPPPRFRRFGDSRSDLYDGELLSVDATLQRVFEYLRERGRLDSTIIVLTADHGEWTGEEGRYGHGADVLERTINIPLLFLGPGMDQGNIVETPVSILDIAPTLVELGGAPIPDSFEGRSLVPALRGQPLEPELVLSHTENLSSIAAFLDDDKLVFNDARTLIRLYDMTSDRSESSDRARLEPQRVRDILAAVQTKRLSREVARRLEDEGQQATLDHYRELVLDDGRSAAERVAAARALGAIDSDESRSTLLQLLEETHHPRALRRWIAASLEGLNAQGFAAETERLASSSEDEMTRALLLRSLRGTPNALDAIEEWHRTPNHHLRRAVASLLAHSDRAVGPEISRSLLDDDDTAVRAMALWHIAKLTVADPEAELRRALAHHSRLIRAAAATACGARGGSCIDDVITSLETTEAMDEKLALARALSPALRAAPDRWLRLAEGPAPLRALAYQALGRTAGHGDALILERLDEEEDDQAREALIVAAGRRRLTAARQALIRQIGAPNFALALAATEALRQIGLEEEDVASLLDVYPRVSQIQTQVNILRLLGTLPVIRNPRAYQLLERVRRTPMIDHHLIRALVEAYARLDDPRAERLRVEHTLYTNFGYHFWLYGYSLDPSHPHPGDRVTLRLLWSIRWNQPEGTSNMLRLRGGSNPQSLERRVVGGRSVDQWPRCSIIVDEVELDFPSDAEEVQITTEWRRGGSHPLPIVYGEQQDATTAVIATIPLTE